MKIQKTITLLLFLGAILVTFSQNEKKQKMINDALTNESIKTQFEILIDKSPTFQNFKNIKLYNLSKFKTNFIDSLKAFDHKINLANTKINTQNKEIENLKETIKTINTDLSNVTEEKDSINFFGVKTTKAAYNFGLWSIIIGLLLTSFVFLFKFKRSNILTKEAKNSYNDIENEFEIHRKKSLEREQILRRKLQDEINKQRNI